MQLDPFTILSGGMHNLRVGITNEYFAVLSVVVIPPPINPTRRTGGSSFDPNYKAPHYEAPVPQEVKSVEEIAELLKVYGDQEILITLEFKPRNRKNLVVECELMEQKVTAELVESGVKNVQVKMIYTEDNK